MSAVLRLGFVEEVLTQYPKLAPNLKMSHRYGFMAPDSMDYIEPAVRLMGGSFLHAGSLMRPPGYPAFLAACGLDPSCTLIAQALLGSLIPVCTLLLTFYLLRNLPLSIFAGLVSTFSPTGIGITGLIMSDLLFAVMFAMGFLLLIYGSTQDHNRWILLSAFIFGLGALIKPILFAWPLVSVVIWALVRRSENKSLTWWPPIILLFVQGFFVVGWSSCNYMRDGVFTLSESGPCTMRYHWAVRVEESARAGHDPTVEAITKNRDTVYKRLHDSHVTPSRRVKACWDESFRIFRSYPTYALLTYFRDINENTEEGWDHFPLQLSLSSSLIEFGTMVSRVESFVRTYTRWPVTLGFVLAFFLVYFRQRPERRRIGFCILALSTACLYFSAFSGVVFWTGPRILYPVEMLAITILAAEIYILAKLIRSITEMLRRR